MSPLDGRTALVTGGGRGIGRATCLELARRGAQVAVNAEPEAAAEVAATVSAVEGQGGEAMAAVADLRDPEAVERMVRQVHGWRRRLDIVVNNAAITRDGLLLGTTDAWFLDVLDVNLMGAVRVTRAALRWLVLSGGGSVVNVSSISAHLPASGHSNYAASKGGMEALTRALAVEWARKRIRVNAVAPGVIRTDLSRVLLQEHGERIQAEVALGRPGEPEEVARAIAFLASDDASYVTGQVLLVDGGFRL